MRSIDGLQRVAVALCGWSLSWFALSGGGCIGCPPPTAMVIGEPLAELLYTDLNEWSDAEVRVADWSADGSLEVRWLEEGVEQVVRYRRVWMAPLAPGQ